MKYIISLLQNTSIESLAHILIRRFDIEIGIITPDIQILMLGQTGASSTEYIKRETWLKWFEHSKAQASPFVNHDSNGYQTIAVPVWDEQKCCFAVFASGGCRDNSQNSSLDGISQNDCRFLIEMLMEMGAQLETQLKKMYPDHDKTHDRSELDKLVACSAGMKNVIREFNKITESDLPVLIQGEFGTGKKRIARCIHACSSRKSGPLVFQNCAVLPETMLASELFGHRRGTVLGALTDKAGLLDIAHHGTFVFEDIDALTPSLQLKLLRLLEDGVLVTLGDDWPHPVNVRIIATCQTPLFEKVKAGLFRPELYYRLCGSSLTLPALKDRREDILPLCRILLEQICAMNQSVPKSLSDEAAEILCRYDWPGNIRELENEIQRLVVLSSGESVIQAACISPRLLQAHEVVEQIHADAKQTLDDAEITMHASQSLDSLTWLPGQTLEAALDEVEKRMITLALAQNQGNRTKTAEVLGISRRNLIRKIDNLHIEG